MALAILDTFTQPDGPPYADWVAKSGTFSILTNRLRATVGGRLQRFTAPSGANICQRMVVETPATFTKTVAFRFRVSADEQNCLFAQWSLGATSITVTLGAVVGGTNSNYATRTLNYTWGSSVELVASVVSDQMMLWVDGTKWLECKQQDWMNSGWNQIVLTHTATYVEEWAYYDLGANAGSYDISAEPDENGSYTVTLYNAGVDWTPGTPGAPVFTCRAGVVESQEVLDADTAVVLYTPPVLTSRDDIYDYINEGYYELAISNPAGVSGPGGGGGGLTTTQAQTLADLAGYLADYTEGSSGVSGTWIQLGAISMLFGTAWEESDGSAAGALLDAVLGTANGLAAIMNRVVLIHELLDDTTGTGGYTLSSVQEAIRGSASRDLTAVYNLIAGLTPADQTDVTDILNAIAAIRTGNLWTLDSVKTWIEAIPAASNQDVLDELALIRTANFWSLGHVMDAIAAITIPDYSTALDDLANDVAAIPTNPITDLSSVLTAISGVRGSGNPDLATLLTAINARPTNPITSLQSVLDAINTLSGHVDSQIELVLDAIAALTPGAGTPTAPVWPGIAGVTLGTPINLAQTFAYSGACDGVIVALTSDPNNHGVYGWGTVTQYPRAGYLSFVSDNGDYSDVQPFSFPSNLICVQGMLHADGFIGRARPGATGTVTPWTITSP